MIDHINRHDAVGAAHHQVQAAATAVAVDEVVEIVAVNLHLGHRHDRQHEIANRIHRQRLAQHHR